MRKTKKTTGKKIAQLQRAQRILRSVENKVKAGYRAEIVGIFGSYARGQQKTGSDIDILVKFSSGATLFDFVGLADFLEEKLRLKVDLVTERALRKELKDEILHEVVAV